MAARRPRLLSAAAAAPMILTALLTLGSPLGGSDRAFCSGPRMLSTPRGPGVFREAKRKSAFDDDMLERLRQVIGGDDPSHASGVPSGGGSAGDVTKLVKEALSELGKSVEDLDLPLEARGQNAIGFKGGLLDEIGMLAFVTDRRQQMQLVAQFGLPDQWDRAQALVFANKWNDEKRLTKAVVDQEGNHRLVMDLDFTPAMPGKEGMMHVLGFFEASVVSWVAEVVEEIKS